MSTPLTRHIKTFNAVTFPTDDILEIIGKVLNSKIHERNLWHLPPSVLGYPEHTSWNDKDSFFDILMDCYDFAIVKRFRSLRIRVSREETADGFVFLNISHFLDERQQAHDPEGFAIFKNVEAVLQELNKSGEVKLENLRDKKKIRNETTCILTDTAVQTSFPDYSVIKQIIAGHEEFGMILNHVAMLGDKGQHCVAKVILHLKIKGIAAFRVKDLVDYLKKASRYVDIEIPSSDIMSDFSKEFSELAVSYNDATEATIDAAGLHESIKKEIDKLKSHKKVKRRLHLLLNEIMYRLAAGKDIRFNEIANEIGKSTSTISEDWTLLKSLAKNNEKIFEKMAVGDVIIKHC